MGIGAREASEIGVSVRGVCGVCVYVCVYLIYVEQNKGSITKEEGETRYWVGNYSLPQGPCKPHILALMWPRQRTLSPPLTCNV